MTAKMWFRDRRRQTRGRWYAREISLGRVAHPGGRDLTCARINFETIPSLRPARPRGPYMGTPGSDPRDPRAGRPGGAPPGGYSAWCRARTSVRRDPTLRILPAPGQPFPSARRLPCSAAGRPSRDWTAPALGCSPRASRSPGTGRSRAGPSGVWPRARRRSGPWPQGRCWPLPGRSARRPGRSDSQGTMLLPVSNG